MSAFSRLKFGICLCLMIMVWLTIPCIGFGQQMPVFPDLKFERYNTKSGLINSVVYSIAQDSLGFIWIGTERGISRYDGTRFKHYVQELNDPNSLPDDLVINLFVDSVGMIWAGTPRYIFRLNPETDKIDVLSIPWEDSNLARPHLEARFYSDSKGDIWIYPSEFKGLIKVNPQTLSTLHIKPDPQNGSLLESPIQGVSEDNEGWLWIAYRAGYIDRLHIETGAIESLTNKDGARVQITDAEINAIYFDEIANQIWIGSDRGLFFYDAVQKSFEQASVVFPDGEHVDVLKLEKGHERSLWIGTRYNGLIYFDLNTGQYRFYQHNIHDPQSLSHNQIENIYVDHSENIWVATDDFLSRADLNRKPFSVLSHYPTNPNSLSSNQVYDLIKDAQGYVWVGTNNGLNKVDVETGEVTRFLRDPNDESSISGNIILSLLSDKEDNLWIGTMYNGLNVKDKKGDTFKLSKAEQSEELSIDEDDILVIYEDSRERLWIGLVRKVILYDRERNSVVDMTKDPEVIGIPRAFLEDQHGVLWMGLTGKGIVGLDVETDQFVHHFLEENAPGLKSDRVFALLEDRDGLIWVGTDAGVSIMERDTSGNPTGKFYSFGKKDGLLFDSIVGFLEDDDGDVWVMTSQGLSRTRKQNLNGEITLSIKNYNQDDGLPSNLFYIGPNYKDDNGIFYMGGDQGMVYFDPLAIKENVIKPKVAITDVELFNKSLKYGEPDSDGRLLLDKTIPYMEELQLKYTDRVMTISFASMHYSNPEKNRYRYRLVGFQDEWVEVLDVQQATYTNLPGGEYIFEVMGANLDGVWSDEKATLKIFVAPPFWETTWFRGLGTLLLVASFAGFYMYRTRAMRRQNQVLEQRVSERTEELSEKNELLEVANVELTALNKEVKAQSENLQEALETNKEILGVTVHDLKNPLGGVIGLSDLILDDAELLDAEEFVKEAVGNVEMMKVEAEHMLKSIQDLLDKYRQEHVAKERREQANLAEILVNVLRWNQKAANDKDIKIINDNTDSVPVLIDVVEIQRAMDNFISNAIKYSPAGTEVQLLLEIKEQVVRFTVKDQGPGLTEEDLTKVFGKLQQLSAKPTAGEHSTGLGLYSAKELVESHGGQVGVDSVYGQGAAFWFELPAAS